VRFITDCQRLAHATGETRHESYGCIACRPEHRSIDARPGCGGWPDLVRSRVSGSSKKDSRARLAASFTSLPRGRGQNSRSARIWVTYDVADDAATGIRAKRTTCCQYGDRLDPEAAATDG
jgi:hypothetical protein